MNKNAKTIDSKVHFANENRGYGRSSGCVCSFTFYDVSFYSECIKKFRQFNFSNYGYLQASYAILSLNFL